MIRQISIAGAVLFLVTLIAGLSVSTPAVLEAYFNRIEQRIYTEKNRQMMREGAETTERLVRAGMVTAR